MIRKGRHKPGRDGLSPTTTGQMESAELGEMSNLKRSVTISIGRKYQSIEKSTSKNKHLEGFYELRCSNG